MIPDEIRQAIQTLRHQGQPLRNISRQLKISRNTVRRALKNPEPRQENVGPPNILSILPKLHSECRGNAVRMQEILHSEHQIDLPYSTLTRLLRQAGLRAPKKRSGTYVFEPGQEMQHDTSPHRIILGDKPVVAQCASLVLGYSRYLFAQYYPRFTRFEAKTFLAEGICFFGGAASRCTIDNTSVLLAGGSGPDAIIAPEMEAFGGLFGTQFIAHAIGHSDRKAHVERNFWYLETNFLAGRHFTDWQDLNRQVRAWCQDVANAKEKRSLGMNPETALIKERPFLIPLPPYVPPIYQSFARIVDCQGYIHLDTNRYSVPERLVGKQVDVHKHPAQVLVFFAHQPVAEHQRLIGKRYAASLIKSHHKILVRGRAPAGPSSQEKDLVGQHPQLDQYVAALKKRSPGRGVTKLRRLLHFRQTYPSAPFLAAVERALQYGLFDLSRLETMILERVAGDFFDLDHE